MEYRFKSILARYKERLLKARHVIGVGFGKKEKDGKKTEQDSIIIMVDKKVEAGQLSSQDLIPESIEGIKTDVVEVGELKLLYNRVKRFRPAPPGVSLGHYQITAGTFGAVVKDVETGETLLLSNNHVLANLTNGFDGRAAPGDPILHPGAYDHGTQPDDIIGYLERFVPLNSVVEKNLEGFNHNLVDCAVARPVEPDCIDHIILDVGEVKGVKEAELNMKVVKSGRTTGVTSGKIKALNSMIKVKMGDNRLAFFDDQIISDSISESGDSGSLALDRDNNAIGLLFAGSDRASVYNRITNVLESLRIEF